MWPEVAPGDVATLIPGAPQPQQTHLDLARIWVLQRLVAAGLTPIALTSDQVLLIRLAIVAKSLSLMAGLGGVVSLGRMAQGVSQVKVGPIEVKLTSDSYGNAVTTASDWERYALEFLGLLLPRRRVWVVGASR